MASSSPSQDGSSRSKPVLQVLKDTHADPHIIAGALEFQCDACSETRQGFSLSKPSAIHSNLGFNEVVGMDKAVWKNDQGTAFSFFHALDEGTLFHLGRLCADDAESQIKCFEELWLLGQDHPVKFTLIQQLSIRGPHGCQECRVRISS